MSKILIATVLAALLIVSASAAPRQLLNTQESRELSDAAEHQRILEELETVHALRDRMLAEGERFQPPFTSSFIFFAAAHTQCTDTARQLMLFVSSYSFKSSPVLKVLATCDVRLLQCDIAASLFLLIECSIGWHID